jgi:O-antigen ligase
MSSIVLLFCLVGASVLPRGRGVCIGAGAFGVGLAIAGGLLAVFRYDVAFIVPCRGACSGLGFTGVLPNENLLGVALTASIPFAFLGFRDRSRIWFVLFLAGMAAATGSRTAAGAAIITLLVLLIVRPSLDGRPSDLLRKAFAALVLAGAAAASVLVLTLTGDATALTGRPQLWSVASGYIDRSPWIGYGATSWQRLYQSSEIPEAAQRSAHNLWMDVLFVGGAFGALLFLAALAIAIATSGRARTSVVLAVATIFMIGTTEGVWAVGTFDFASFSFVALLLIGASRAAGGDAAPYPHVVTRPRANPAYPSRR